MAQNKLEQDFKNKLEQRTIEPSAMAWDRLDAMLSVTEEKRKPKRRTWMYVAASFLGFMLVGTILLQQEKESTGNTIDNTVVNAGKPAEDKVVEETMPIVIDEFITTPAQKEAIAVQQNDKAGNKVMPVLKQQAQGDKNYLPKMEQVNNESDAVAVHEIYTDAANESEKLLAASIDHSNEKKPSIRVNANSLLSSVEGELDNNFRNEMLKKVVKNYNTVKTSVANRNYQ